MSNGQENIEQVQKTFFGPVSRDDFITNEDWRSAINCAFDDMENPPRIDNVKVVMAISPGEHGISDWLAIIKFDLTDEWHFVQAGTPSGNWAEGLGTHIEIGSQATDAANSPILPESAFIRFLPQFVRLHAERKINLYSAPSELTSAAIRIGHEAAFNNYFNIEGGE